MKYRTTAALIALGALIACDEAPPTSTETDTAPVEDTTGDSSTDVPEADATDASDDIVEDSTTDTQPDIVEDTPVDTPEPDVAEVGDAADTADAPEEVDVAADVDTDAGDTGVACSDDPTVCEDPYECIDDVCRMPLDERAWVESDFDIIEPAELTRIFEFLKSFADDVKFLVIDVGPSTLGPAGTAVSARYGAADILDAEASPISVAYQDPGGVGDMTFRPVVTDEAPLDGDSWETEPFRYELQASAHVEFPGLDPVDADFGLFAEEVVVSFTFHIDEDENNTGTLVGLVTREETEDRRLAGRDEIPGFETLFCSVSPYDPGEDWNLSDVLDCNEAEMDADFDGDGVNDSYIVVIDAVFEAAALER